MTKETWKPPEMMVNVAQQDGQKCGEEAEGRPKRLRNSDNYFHFFSPTSFKIPGIVFLQLPVLQSLQNVVLLLILKVHVSSEREKVTSLLDYPHLF